MPTTYNPLTTHPFDSVLRLADGRVVHYLGPAPDGTCAEVETLEGGRETVTGEEIARATSVKNPRGLAQDYMAAQRPAPETPPRSSA